MPKVVFHFDDCLDDIQYSDGSLLVFRGDGTIVNEGLYGLLVFSPKQHA